MNTPDINSMTDEEFDKLDPSDFPTTPVEPTEPVQEQEPSEGEEVVEQDKQQEDVVEEEPVPDTEEQLAVYRDFYHQMTTPFKADGREIQIKNAEDAIRLAQMGANYSRRMQEIKKARGREAMLQKHGVNTDEELSYLLDLKRGDKEAIRKMLSENDIDPIEFDASDQSDYKPTNYVPNYNQVEFEDKMGTMSQDPDGMSLIRHIDKSWDMESKQTLGEAPQNLDILLQQKKSGAYDLITQELDYERSVGKYNDVPFLAAYKEVGIRMENEGAFAHIQENGASTASSPVGSGPAIGKATATSSPNPSAVGQPRTVANSKPQKRVNYSSMSDEDFLKLAPPG